MKVLLFSIASERFAAPLAGLDQSLDAPEIHPVPGAAAHAVGVIELRGRHIAAYSPAGVLCVSAGDAPGAALVMGGTPGESGDEPIALLVSDVDDVFDLDPSEMKITSGMDSGDGIVIGVFERAGSLVTLVDPYSIRDACLSASGAAR